MERIMQLGVYYFSTIITLELSYEFTSATQPFLEKVGNSSALDKFLSKFISFLLKHCSALIASKFSVIYIALTSYILLGLKEHLRDINSISIVIMKLLYHTFFKM